MKTLIAPPDCLASGEKDVKVKWIEVKRSETDRRVWLMTTAAAARDRIAALKVKLAAELRAQRAGQTPAPARKPNASSAVRKRIERQPKSDGFF